MSNSSSKLASGVAKVLGVDLNYRDDEHSSVTRGESVQSVSAGELFVDDEPRVSEWLKEIVPTAGGVKSYVRDLFPFLAWITRYNSQWFLGDLIAGLTVGAVVVPQGMAYALLAKLPAEYGLYTSFMGFILYWAFATSKDITIGTVAVMSTLVGNIVIKVQDTHPDIPAEEIARTLALISGLIILFIGLARIGWIVEWIPLTAITAFMTGSAISIAVGQIPTLLGITGLNTRDATYIVFIETLKALPRTKLDAAMGLSALFLLYFIRYVFSVLMVRWPAQKKTWFFLSTLRIAFVILLYVLISYLANKDVTVASKAKFKILGTVPRGFTKAGAPKLNSRTISAFASELPATIIVLLIEHIAISKSFGRINNYTINPSQELVAIGFSNIFGPFLGAYPATGSFSRTAIKSKAGVRTPLAGIFTAIVVLLALYALTSVFFYIPSASLAAVIIHAVGDLISPPSVVYQFWEISPIEVLVFFAGVLVTIFTTIETGIYVTVSASAAILLYRVSQAEGSFMGRVRIQSAAAASLGRTNDFKEKAASQNNDDVSSSSGDIFPKSRDVFLPLDHKDGSNPKVRVETPTPGVFIYRFSEGFNYPNVTGYMQGLTETIFKVTRRTTLDAYGKLGDRPWNDPGPRRGAAINLDDNRPTLKAIILDFSAVNNVDVSSVQGLIDVRNQLDRYTAPDTVDWHMAGVTNRWTKRALASGGFGYLKSSVKRANWTPIFSAAEAEVSNDFGRGEKEDLESQPEKSVNVSTAPVGSSPVEATSNGELVPLYGADRPFFHVDVISALESAEANIRAASGVAVV